MAVSAEAHPTPDKGPMRANPRLVAVNNEKLAPNPAHSVGLDAEKIRQAQEKTEIRIQRLEQLLTFEGQVREVKSLRELHFCVVNEALPLTSANQIFIAARHHKTRKRLRLAAVSHVSHLEANGAAVVALGALFMRMLAMALARAEDERKTPLAFQLPPFDDNGVPDFTIEGGEDNAVLVPLFDAYDRWMGCLVMASPKAGLAQEAPLIQRLAQVTEFAWQALAPVGKLSAFHGVRKFVGLGAVLLMLATLFLRVPLSTLAPVEIVAAEPEVVAAPINGVIRKVLVDANTEVEAGTPLFQYEDTVLLSELKIAEQAWSLANARLKKAQQSSFGEGAGKRDLATAQAELDLAFAELEFAKAKYAQTTVRAPKRGVVIVDRKSDWQGKPVSVGQRVLEIARTAEIEARIDLAVSDAIVLKEGAAVQLYLDTNPLKALDGHVVSASYRASLDVANELSFAVSARLDESVRFTPRIGARGTAQIYGDDVSLGFYLFRRPLAAIRQWVGW